MSKDKIKIGLHENIAKNIIFVDGLARTGKTMFNSIIPSLENVEHTKVVSLIDQIVPAVSLGIVSVQFAKALLRMTLNEIAYNTLISRNMNFRYEDLTGIFKFKDPMLYFKRLTFQDGEAITEELRRNKYLFPIRTQELLLNFDSFSKLEIDYKMLAEFRNPIDTIHSWWLRGYGDRLGNDPRAFMLTVEVNNHQIPWYFAGNEKEWFGLNPLECCIYIVVEMTKRAIIQYKKATGKDRIHLMRFEKFLMNPHDEIEKICRFLNTQQTLYTEYIIKKELRPSVLEPKAKEKKISAIKANVKSDLFDKMMEMSDSYESNFYGLF